MANPSRRGSSASRCAPCLEENLIGADASILTFVRHADGQPCRLVISGSEISGLVSLADLQHLPVRAALFGMVTHLEIVMADAIRREFSQGDDWADRLSTERRGMFTDKAAAAKREDARVEPLLFTQFCDKITIIKKRPDFPWSKAAFKNDLQRIEALRNDLAHANDYASTREAARKVCETVRLMETWTELLMEA